MTTITVSDMKEADAKLAEMGIDPDETPQRVVVKGLTVTHYYYIDHEEVAIVESTGTFQPGRKPTLTVTDCRKTTDEVKEDTTMTSINEIKSIFTFENRVYTKKTNGYCFVTENGKTRRIKSAEFDTMFKAYAKAAHAEAINAMDEDAENDEVTLEQFVAKVQELDAEQAKLDEEPCKVEVENDLEKPAVLNEYGCVDCSGCHVEHCVHRNCMRRNPRSEGGLAECPRLKVIPQPEPEEDTKEAEEPLVQEDAKKKEKPAKKPRRSKDIAHESHGVTLTAKQVDFIRHLPDTCYWENGIDSAVWVDCLCDEIGGQFAGKPMTVGAMISTLCEKKLGMRVRDESRKGKPTSFFFTDLGRKIARELGLK